MISKTEVTRKKMIRGAIIEVLHKSQSAPLPVKTLELHLMSGGFDPSGELVPAINYLCDRGYIRAFDDGDADINPYRGMSVRLTADGQDVYEHTKEDPGLLFCRED